MSVNGQEIVMHMLPKTPGEQVCVIYRAVLLERQKKTCYWCIALLVAITMLSLTFPLISVKTGILFTPLFLGLAFWLWRTQAKLDRLENLFDADDLKTVNYRMGRFKDYFGQMPDKMYPLQVNERLVSQIVKFSMMRNEDRMSDNKDYCFNMHQAAQQCFPGIHNLRTYYFWANEKEVTQH